MRKSRRELLAQTEQQAARIEHLIDALTDAKTDARVTATVLECVSGELSRTKDVIASHLVAAGHPSTVLHDVHHFRDSLQQALTDAGVDLRIELARLEGSDL